MTKHVGYLAAMLAAGMLLGTAVSSQAIELTSPAFRTGEQVPVRYSCKGKNISPPLAIAQVPKSARSLALIVADPDAPSGMFIHWVVYNLPPTTTNLATDVPKRAVIAGGGEQGLNGRGHYGYFGMCPPPGPPHHYHFELYALDRKLELKAPDAARLEAAMKGHILAHTELVALFGR